MEQFVEDGFERASYREKETIILWEHRDSWKRCGYWFLIGAILLLWVFVVIGIIQITSRENTLYQILGYNPNQPPQYGAGQVTVFGTMEETGWDEILDKQKEKEERYYAEQTADIQAAREQVRNLVDKVFIRYYILFGCLYAVYAILVRGGFYNRYLQFVRYTIKIQKGRCIGKEKLRYRYSTEYYMHIALDNGQIINKLSVGGAAYRDIEFDDSVIVARLEGLDDGIVGVYNGSIFS